MILVLITYCTAILAPIDTLSFEQRALDYFAIELFPQYYSTEKVIYFSGRSEGVESIGWPFSECFNHDSTFSQFYSKHKETASSSVTINYSGFSTISKAKKPKGHQLYLRIYKAVRMGDIILVYIRVYKRDLFSDHFLLRISPSDSPEIAVCHVNEII